MTDVAPRSATRWADGFRPSAVAARNGGAGNGGVPDDDAHGHLPVRFQPVLPLSAVLNGAPAFPTRPFPLDQPKVTLTFSGTAAVYQTFRALRLPAGSVVLCPSYNCGHEIEPLLRLGLQVRCYRINAALEADLDDIERRMDQQVRALLVTHFFGFGQRLEELRSLCDRRGVFLIEDCAHAFLSNNVSGNLGRVGDAAIYSIRKSLPLPNGGAVLLNNPALALPEALEKPPKLTTWLKALDLAKKSVLDQFGRDRSWNNLLPLGALTPLVAGSDLLQRLSPSMVTACYDPDDENFNFSTSILNWGISPFSMRLLDRINWRNIAARRLYNYRFLVQELRGLTGCQIVRPEVPDCTSPLFLPILVTRRQEVFRFLLQHRIYPAIWWNQKHPAVDWADFPDATDLKNRVLALPVHQDIDDEQLAHLLETIRRCSAL